MRYLTKEWYQDMQDSDLHVLLRVDDRAEVFSEAYFQELYQACEEKWLAGRAKICEILKVPFNVEDERGNYQSALRLNKERFQERLTQHILCQVADIRVLALGYCTQAVRDKIASYSESKRKSVEQTMSQCLAYERSLFAGADASLLDDFSFHDERVISSQKVGADWLIDFGECVEGYSPVRYIHFKNATVRKQEKCLCGAFWLYEELYKTENGYEVHILLDKDGLVEFTLTCEDIVME